MKNTRSQRRIDMIDMERRKFIREVECPQCGCVATEFPLDDRIVCEYCGFLKENNSFRRGYGSIWFNNETKLLDFPLTIQERLSLYENDDVLELHVWDVDQLQTLKGNTPIKKNEIEQMEMFREQQENRSFTKNDDNAIPWDMLDD